MKGSKKFQKTVWEYYREHGRRSLPWRKTRNPYRILVSEIMLQQTQVDRVISYYISFLKKFPTIGDLARAKRASVLRAWQGLGYNRRALYLHNAVKGVVKKYKGKLPRDYPSLVALPGIGPATAGDILIFAYNEPYIVIETNIRTVFIHHFFGDKKMIKDKEILPIVEKTLDRNNPREWYWALMDYGSFLKKEQGNIAQKSFHYKKQSPFEGSLRQLRARIVRLLLKNSATLTKIKKECNDPRTEEAIASLLRDGTIQKTKGGFKI